MYALGPRSSDAAADDLTIGYVGGGSRNWAITLVNDLAQCADLGGTVRLYDVDRESARLNAKLGNRIDRRDGAVGAFTYEAVPDLESALDAADFVVLSTQDPPAETFAHDLDIPRRYGIYQTVGDTVGPGGTLRAMRAIPQYREIATAVREHCPNAWVLNYTNPMTVCTRTLYEAYPGINALGLCHEVAHTQDFLASVVADRLDAEPDGDGIDVDVSGVNHFTWLTGARWRGRDLFPLLDDALADRRPLPRFEPGDMADADYFVDSFDVTFDLYDRYGALPAAGDRHLVEFVPRYLRIDAPEGIHRWGIRLTPSDYRTNRWPEDDARRERILAGEEAFAFHDSGEEVVDVIRALSGIEPLRTNVNVPNRGQAPDLPDGAVVETNALLSADTLRPLAAGPLPREVRTLVLTHLHNGETLVEAGVAGDLDRAYRAFLNDPLVELGPIDARNLFRDLVAAERDYLGEWDLDGSELAG